MSYPRRRDKLEREIERQDCIKFAQHGGTPAGAPSCYGAPTFDEPLMGRKHKRHCNSCDNLLQEMCKQYSFFLKKLKRAKEIAYESTKETLALEYKVRAQGKFTSVKLERLKRRKKK